MTFAICIDNEGYKASLELRKIYQVVSAEPNDPKRYLRIIDESGEDYLYNAKAFEPVDLPARTERKLIATLSRASPSPTIFYAVGTCTHDKRLVART